MKTPGICQILNNFWIFLTYDYKTPQYQVHKSKRSQYMRTDRGKDMTKLLGAFR